MGQILFLIFATVIQVHALSQRPMPPITEVPVQLDTADQAVDVMYVASDSVKTPKGLEGRLVFDKNVIQYEAQAILDLVADKSVPNSEKEIVLGRYTMGMQEVTRALIIAKKAGVPVTIVTDFNPIATVDFKDNEKSTTDPQRISFKGETNDQPAWMSELTASGYVVGKDVFSIPVFNTKLVERIPLMHEKFLLLRAGKRKTTFFGSANMAPNPRYNIVYKSTLPEFYDPYLDHARALIDVLAKGLPTSQMPDRNQVQLIAKDKTTITLGFTDGKFNPNDRIATALTQNTLVEGILSHFVITDGDVINALKNAMLANPESTMLVVGDDKFATLKGFGMFPNMLGVDVETPFHKINLGFDENLWKRIRTVVYQRKAIDPATGKVRIETSMDGPPTGRHVWHAKMTLLRLRNQMNTIFRKLFTGSFNLSNNTVNAEFQAEFTLPDDSWLAAAHEYATRAVVDAEPDYALPGLVGTIRIALGDMFHIDDLDIPVSDAQDFQKAVFARDLAVIERITTQVSKLKTNLKEEVPQEARQKTLDQFLGFLNWYVKNVPQSDAEMDTKIRRFLSMARIFSHDKFTTVEIRHLLQGIVSRSNLTTDETNKLIDAGILFLAKVGLTAIPDSPPSSGPPHPASAPNPAHANPVANCAGLF